MSEITHYQDKRIDDMTRDELIEALKDVGALYHQTLARESFSRQFLDNIYLTSSPRGLS